MRFLTAKYFPQLVEKDWTCETKHTVAGFEDYMGDVRRNSRGLL